MTATRIRELREAKGLTQDQLGAAVGTNKFKISRIEKGDTQLDLDLAVKIAQALDVSLAEVVGVERDCGRGFDEDAEVYDAPATDPLHRLADAGQNRSLYRVKSNVLDEIGIRAGDILLIDISAGAIRSIKPLSIVVAQLYSARELLEATTLLRQYVPPSLLITNSRDENQPPISMATTDAHIKGVVISRHQNLVSGLS